MNTNLAYQEEIYDEMINGQIVLMSPSPMANHVYAAGNIYRIFADYLKGKICTPFPDRFDLYLSEKDRFEPDMMIVCDPNKIKSRGVYGAPDLVVEVLSRSTSKRPVEMVFAQLRPEKVEAAILREEMHAHNTFEEPEKVKEEAFDAYEIKDGKICFTAPACSVISFRIA